MRNLWLVARHEYRKIAGKKSFLISTIGIPILICLVMGITIVVTLTAMDRRPVGYVDSSGILQLDAQQLLADEQPRLLLVPYPDGTSARAALESGEIQAYYVLPTDYLEAPVAHLYYADKAPSQLARQRFAYFMRANLVQQLPEAYQERVLHGSQLTVRSSDGAREASSDNIVDFAVPFVAVIFFFIAVLSAGGYMFQAVADEKENRTMEVLMTSLTANELIGGKSLGLIAVVLTQLFLWILTLTLAIIIGAQFVPELQAVRVPWALLAVTAVYFLPAYVLIASLMTTVGAAAPETEQGQQISGLLNLLFTFPMFFLAIIFANPNHPFIVLLSIFPTTSFTTILFRWSFTVIPLWQLALSWTLLVITALAGIWLAARVFRLGMLQYGQALSLKGIVATLRAR